MGYQSIKVGAIAISVFLLLSSCASPQYAYIPSEHQAAEHGVQRAEAVYSEPANLPQGQIKIVSLGVVRVKQKGQSKEFAALHLKMSITNQSDPQGWTINTQDQSVAFPNEGQSAPLMINPAVSSVVQVDQGQLKTIDYYFPLPDQQTSAKSLPEFDFHWRLDAGNQTVQETTSFDRIELPTAVAMDPYGPWPYYPYYYSGYYWGGGPRWGGGYVVVHR